MTIDKKWMMILAVVVIIVLIAYIGLNLSQKDDTLFIVESMDNQLNETVISDINSQNIIIVDVKGEVLKPGVYEMSEGDRVVDVIDKAGGFTDEADETTVNLAQRIYDEMVIIVPKKNEEVNYSSGANQNSSQSNKIRVNTASKEELMTLPGIGEQKALSIIEFREKNGFFQTKEDLLQISGIGEKTLERLEDYIIVP